ncbi:MAG TPA: DEAD/DEAH box helicase [Cytophagales bacterium]|nr:DEAD/DEAH box helicase [Cytophagales bacterium]
MRFEDYNIAPEIKENLAELGFRKPTDIQFKAIKPILDGEDVLAIAQTGTGKTAAFAIPVIDMIHRQKRSNRSEYIRCIVMVPTHELAMQITEAFHKIEKHTFTKTMGIYGGVSQDPQISALIGGIDIIVATPGRLFDLASQGYLHLDKVQTLILDEADHMLDLGFYDDISDLIKRLPKNRQTLFFSATINETVKKLAYSIVSKAIRIQIAPKDRVSKNITHSVAFIAMDHKRFFLERVVAQNPNSKIIVFVRTRVRAERVAAAMSRVNITTVTMHGDKEQADRKQALDQFRNGDIRILIATDVSARGIDIPNVDYVINYDIPDVVENYVHRVGRTGRGMQKGIAISFCSEEEKELLQAIEEFLESPINIVDIDKNTYQETLDFTSDTGNNDWKSLIKNAEKEREAHKAKKKKR